MANNTEEVKSQNVPGQAQLASLGDRVLGQIVDLPVGFGIFFYVGMKIAGRFGGRTGGGFKLNGAPALLALVIVSFLYLLYFIFSEAYFGATLGKLVAGTKVTDLDGARISLRASVIRNVLRIVDVGMLVGLVAIIATRRNQRLGDLAAGTIVTRSESSRAVKIAALAGALAVAIVGVVVSKATTTASSSAEEVVGGLSQYKPPAGGAIEEVSLCSSDNDKFVPSRVGTSFPSGTHEVVVYYRWESGQGTKVDIKWGSGGSVLLAQNETLTEPSAHSAWAFKTASGHPVPDGDYSVELFENGKRVTAIPFHVGSAGT